MNTGSALARFTITLSQAVTEPVQVEWFTSDGTAKAGVDYAANKGTVLFAPGETSKTVDILVYGRAVGSEDRSFYVEMLPPTNAILGASIGECIITVDTSGSTPVTAIIVPTGPKGEKGDPGEDGISPDPGTIAEEVAPLIDVGDTVLTAQGTEALGKPDQTTVKAIARRVAYAGAAKIATVVLADGDNTLVPSNLTGDTIDFSAGGFVPYILRAGVIAPASWDYSINGSIVVHSAVAGDVLYAVQYGTVSKMASRAYLLTRQNPFADIKADGTDGTARNNLRLNNVSRVYDSITAMRADTQLKVGETVEWLGYYARADGGGNTGVVKSGSVTYDNGSTFLLNNGLYVEAIFGSYIDPLQFGLREENTAAQNKVALDNTIKYGLANKRPIIQLRVGTYNTDPIDIEGSAYDWFYWQCKKGDVTYICTNETTPLLTVRGIQISNTESNFMNTFQYCTIDGFRFSSPYCMLRYAYMEKYLFTNLIMSGRANAAGNFVCDAIVGPMLLREAAVWGEISNMVFANCNRAFRSGVGYQSELATKHVLVGDSTFKDWDIQNCGFVDGTYVVDCGYFDGGFFDNIQWHMNAAQPFVANVHCMRMYKPQLCRFKNCNFFEPNGIGLRLLSPRNCRVDSSNIIWGAGEIGTQPGLSIGNFDNITSINNKFSPMIVNCWGSAVIVQAQNDIDFTGLIEHNNCLAGNGIPGIALQGCTGTKLYDIQMDSLGGAAISVDAASCEVRNIDYRRYTSQTSRVNGGTINCIPSNRIRQVSSAVFAGIFDDEVQYNATSGTASVTLPPAEACPGKLIRVIKTDSTINGVAIFVSSGSGNTINGASSYSLTAQYSFVQLRSTGDNWLIVGKS